MITFTRFDVAADRIVVGRSCVDYLKVHSTATTEALYNIAERLIEELDAEAKHMRSLGLFG